MLQGAGVLHGQMHVRDCQLVGQIVDVLHALLHLGQLLLKQLQGCEKERRGRGRVRRTQENRSNMKHSVPHASVYTPLALTNVRGACVCRAEEKDGCHCFDVCFVAPALQR